MKKAPDIPAVLCPISIRKMWAADAAAPRCAACSNIHSCACQQSESCSSPTAIASAIRLTRLRFVCPATGRLSLRSFASRRLLPGGLDLRLGINPRAGFAAATDSSDSPIDPGNGVYDGTTSYLIQNIRAYSYRLDATIYLHSFLTLEKLHFISAQCALTPYKYHDYQSVLTLTNGVKIAHFKFPRSRPAFVR